jgi:hypothetical protein
MALGSAQPLGEMSTRILSEGKGWPARKPDNLTAICEPIVQKMWDPRLLRTLKASTACYKDSLSTYTFGGWFNLHDFVVSLGSVPYKHLSSRQQHDLNSLTFVAEEGDGDDVVGL